MEQKPPVVDIKIKNSLDRSPKKVPTNNSTDKQNGSIYYIHPVTTMSPEILEEQQKAMMYSQQKNTNQLTQVNNKFKN
jgi:hypothetical protein